MAAKDEDIMHGPYTFDLNIYMSNGTQVAVAKCSLPVGVLPTREVVDALLQDAQAQAHASSPDFKLMERNEFENTILAERSGGLTAGQKFATKQDWDPPPPSTREAVEALMSPGR